MLSQWAALAVVAGTMLGVGVFIGPPQSAALVADPTWLLMLWGAGGVAALCGGLAVAELGAMIPRSGGDYVYLREAYGPGISFAAGWLQLLAIFPGSAATLAAALATYQLPALFGPGANRPLLIGGLVVVALTAINHRGIVVSGRLQVALTGVPVLALGLAAAAVLFGPAPTGQPPPPAPDGATGVGAAALAAAYLPVYFAYSGWNATLYIAGEVKDPAKTLPRSLGGGTAAVTVLYLMLCAAFLAVLGPAGLAEAGEAGSASAERLLGEQGRAWVAGLLSLTVLSSLNGTLIGGARVASAMAERGDAPQALARVSDGAGAPATALWAQAAWSIVLLATGGVQALLDYTTGAMLLTGALTVLAVPILRRRPQTADLPRPYRTPFGATLPVLFCASTAVVFVTLAVAGHPSILAAVAWFAAALAVHAIRSWARSL